MSGHFVGSHQLVQKLECIKPITLIVLQEKQKEWSLYLGFHQLVQKLECITPIISALQDKQNEWSLYRVSSTGSKIGMKNTKYFFSSTSRQIKRKIAL